MSVSLMNTSCGKIKNTSSSDKAIYGLTNQGSAQFKLAFVVIAKNCLACHAWSNYNESDFVTDGHIVANDPAQSSIYFHLINNDTSIAGDMPLSGNALTSDDIATIKAWVQVAN